MLTFICCRFFSENSGVSTRVHTEWKIILYAFKDLLRFVVSLLQNTKNFFEACETYHAKFSFLLPLDLHILQSA